MLALCVVGQGTPRKEICVERRVLRQVPFPTKSGRTMLLEVTDRGLVLLRRRAHLSDKGPPLQHRGGLEHEYWRHQDLKGANTSGSQICLEMVCIVGRACKCPYCRSTHTIWKGYRGRQADKVRLRQCKDCGRKFTSRRTVDLDLQGAKPI